MKEGRMMKLNDNTMNIFLSITEDYFIHALELIFSIRKHSSMFLHIYMMVDQKCIDDFSKKTDDIHFQDVQITLLSTKTLDELISKDHQLSLTKMTYGRLIIFEQLKNVDKILYLDTDMIVVNDGLDDVYNIAIDDKYAAVVEEISMECFNPQELMNCNVKKYFNGGFVLFNIQKILNDDIHNIFIDMLKNPPDFMVGKGWGDQTIMNKAFHENVLFIDPKYNIQSILFGYPQYTTFAQQHGYVDQFDMMNHCVVSHMQGAKPWEDRWDTWQKWQVPLKEWQKKSYINNHNAMLNEYPELMKYAY